MKALLLLTVFALLLWAPVTAQTNACREGDTDNDGKISLADYQVWRRIFTGGSATVAPTNAPTVSIKSHGARGDGVSDDTTAMQNSLNAAGAGRVVLVPAGTYIQTNTLDIPSGVTLKGDPAGAGTIKATNPDRQAIYLRGTNSNLIGMTLTSTATVRRESDWHQRVVLEHSTGSIVSDNQIIGGSAAGIFAFGAKNYKIVSNTIRETLADAIHNTNKSSFGEVRDNTVETSGDDGVAVVSYMKDGGYTHHITITGNVINNPKARGISVVGGTNVLVENNSIKHTRAAGIYLNSEVSYQTYAVKDVTVNNNVIDEANYETPIHHAGIFVSAREGTAAQDGGTTVTLQNERISFNGNTVKNTLALNWHVVFLRPYTSQISLKNTTIIGSTAKKSFQSDLAANLYNAVGNTFNGAPLPDHIGDPNIK